MSLGYSGRGGGLSEDVARWWKFLQKGSRGALNFPFFFSFLSSSLRRIKNRFVPVSILLRYFVCIFSCNVNEEYLMNYVRAYVIIIDINKVNCPKKIPFKEVVT